MEPGKWGRSGAARGRGRAWDKGSATSDDGQLFSAAFSPALRFPAERFRERMSRFGSHPRSSGQVPPHQIQRRSSTVDECNEHSAHCAIKKTTCVGDSADDGAAWFQYQHDPGRKPALFYGSSGHVVLTRPPNRSLLLGWARRMELQPFSNDFLPVPIFLASHVFNGSLARRRRDFFKPFF